jgi:maltooligosyltrehalose trehalohydrolase
MRERRRQFLSMEQQAKYMRQETVRDVGAMWLGEGRCRFRVWAPNAESLAVHLLAPEERIIQLEREPGGYFAAEVAAVPPEARYLIRFADGHERPDPASRYQPEGVHGPSAVVVPYAGWTDADWRGTMLTEYVISEMHVGTFTPEGTFDAIIPRLDDLIDLGITALEIMPIAQFPGSRNWGYDGVDPFAVQHSYGGPAGFARLVDACHARGLAVILDVVYNHLGPEGNYLRDFGPYFTAKYRTPWGDAINFDDAESDAVRGYFIQNALQWVQDFHVDALRLDAAHAITDTSAHPFLAELAEHVHAAGERLGRHVYLIAESDLNDPRLVDVPERNGLGLDAQWSDDLHHALHTLLTGEQAGYYADFGSIDHLVRALRDGYAYAGDYSPVRRRSHGAPARAIPAWRFVVSSQNHDQVGNRMLGERLSQIVAPDALRLAAGVILLSPYVPLLFMGEEYGAQQPFLFFTSHGDPDLIRAVREGRRAEFAAFAWQGEAPDPHDEATFTQSRPAPAMAQAPWQHGLRALYHELLRMRRTEPALMHLSKDDQEVQGFPAWQIVTQRRWHLADELFAIYHFGAESQTVPLPVPPGIWHMLLCSDDERWVAPSCRCIPSLHGNPAETLLHGNPAPHCDGEGNLVHAGGLRGAARRRAHRFNHYRPPDPAFNRPPAGGNIPPAWNGSPSWLSEIDASNHSDHSPSDGDAENILESPGALELALAPRSFLVLARRAERID